MDNLLTINEDNIGGIQILQFAPRYYFQSVSPGAIVFKDGRDWINIEIISQTGTIDHESVTDDGGDYYNVSASAALPKERPDIDSVLDQHKGLPCLVKMKDQNGYTRITGCFLGELLISHTSTSGTKAEDENGYRISFKGKQTLKAQFL